MTAPRPALRAEPERRAASRPRSRHWSASTWRAASAAAFSCASRTSTSRAAARTYVTQMYDDLPGSGSRGRSPCCARASISPPTARLRQAAEARPALPVLSPPAPRSPRRRKTSQRRSTPTARRSTRACTRTSHRRRSPLAWRATNPSPCASTWTARSMPSKASRARAASRSPSSDADGVAQPHRDAIRPIGATPIIVRKDVPASYHLAVTVDDGRQGVTHVTRGRDLFAATSLHRLLQVLLGLPGAALPPPPPARPMPKAASCRKACGTRRCVSCARRAPTCCSCATNWSCPFTARKTHRRIRRKRTFPMANHWVVR